jgi:sterol desaturase/sphingolipid hydroxylase (fatty acid hydroxylase superfamily)
MPKTKLQDVIFTIIMVIVMVYGMVVFNISIDKGGLTNEVFVLAFGELIIMGIIGFVLEMLLAGPLAKKLAFRLVTPGEDKMFAVILAISSITVCLMCPMMSFVATVLFKGVDSQLMAKWLQITALNFPMALCWQIFFAGPFVRLIFRHIFPEKQE